MSDRHTDAPSRLLIIDEGPEPTKIDYHVEVEVRTNHFHSVRPRRPNVKYFGYSWLSPFAFSDLEICVRVNGEEVARETDCEGDSRLVGMRHGRVAGRLQGHVEDELKRVVTNLLRETVARLRTSEDREKFIEEREKEESREIRRRLPTVPGRWTPEEIGAFCDRALAALRELNGEEKEVNRTNLAAKLYPNNENQLQALRRDVERAGYNNPTKTNEFDGFLSMLKKWHADGIESVGAIYFNEFDSDPLSTGEWRPATEDEIKAAHAAASKSTGKSKRAPRSKKR